MRAYRVAYDGRAYHGFQRQPDVETVEGAIFDALRAAGLAFQDAPPGYAAAGRTDAGVSALAQTIAFEAPEWLSPRALSAHLPDDVHVWASADVPTEFHATHDARSRSYTYFLSLPEIDSDRIEALEDRLEGSHDFHNLSAAETGTVRDLAIEGRHRGDFRVLTLTADGFPRQLVRRLATLYEWVARGERSLSFVDRVLAAEPLPGPDGIPPASPEALLLAAVRYDLDFDPSPRALADAETAVADRVRRDRARVAVGEAIANGLEAADSS